MATSIKEEDKSQLLNHVLFILAPAARLFAGGYALPKNYPALATCLKHAYREAGNTQLEKKLGILIDRFYKGGHSKKASKNRNSRLGYQLDGSPLASQPPEKDAANLQLDEDENFLQAASVSIQETGIVCTSFGSWASQTQRTYFAPAYQYYLELDDDEAELPDMFGNLCVSSSTPERYIEVGGGRKSNKKEKERGREEHKAEGKTYGYNGTYSRKYLPRDGEGNEASGNSGGGRGDEGGEGGGDREPSDPRGDPTPTVGENSRIEAQRAEDSLHEPRPYVHYDVLKPACFGHPSTHFQRAYVWCCCSCSDAGMMGNIENCPSCSHLRCTNCRFEQVRPQN